MEFGIDQIISVAVGILTPWVTKWLNSTTWDGWKIQLTVFGIAVVIAVGANLLTGGFSGKDIVTNIGLVFGASELVYRQWVKKVS